MHDHGQPWMTTVDRQWPWTTTVDYQWPWSTINDHGRPWTTMVDRQWPWLTVNYHGRSSMTMVDRQLPWSTVNDHGHFDHVRPCFVKWHHGQWPWSVTTVSDHGVPFNDLFVLARRVVVYLSFSEVLLRPKLKLSTYLKSLFLQSADMTYVHMPCMCTRAPSNVR